jgi:two-component system, response regulator, stage 0 sporulation protein F
MNKKPRLLIVDNEMDVCNFVKSFFEIRGFDVLTAFNGDEALKALEHVRPDLIILDVMMRTEREGLDYLPRVKKASPGSRIIMITGVDDKEAIETAKKLGADDYITKPLVLEYLESSVLGKVNILSRK